MRKRWIDLFCAVILLLTACAVVKEPQENMEQPVRFYYCFDRNDETYGGETGAMGWEWRDLGPERLTALEILEQYLQGPKSQKLTTPYPPELTVEGVLLENGLLTVNLSEEALELTGVERTLAAACLVYTMTQFSDITALRLTAGEAPLTGVWGETLELSDFLPADDTATSDQVTVRLYFSDLQGRYLQEETRSKSSSGEEELPEYILQQLLVGPESENARNVLPEGTKLLGVQTEEGVCTVNFSMEFLRNRPKTHRLARLAVFAVVNSLTELPQVECVRFLCEGESPGQYQALDLSQPLYREELALRTESREEDYSDVTLYLPCGQQPLLVAVPLMLRRTGGNSLEADVLQALLAFEPANGYENPIPEGTRVLELTREGSLCRVCFDSTFAECEEDPAQARQAVRSVAASLCGLDGINQVQISIRGETLTAINLAQPLSPDKDWIME